MADIMLAETKRSMVEHANQVIVVCDHTKLGNTSLAQFATPAQIDTIVLDTLPEDAADYHQAGIALLSVQCEE
ncbi:HTH-type transcriptional repressor glcR [Yersinia frederiksenii]|nr:HTH-type transcriptional repressor glcR [Yersinia frederiksenii]